MINQSPAKSTAGDGLRERNNEFFKNFYFLLLKHFEPLLSVSRIDKISFDKLFIFDSSTIRLFSQVMKGVGRNPKGEGKKKDGLKVHMFIDAHSQTPTFVKISEAKSHDKNFIQYLNLAPHSMIVFDRAYNQYIQFAKFTKNQMQFMILSNKFFVKHNQILALGYSKLNIYTLNTMWKIKYKLFVYVKLLTVMTKEEVIQND